VRTVCYSNMLTVSLEPPCVSENTGPVAVRGVKNRRPRCGSNVLLRECSTTSFHLLRLIENELVSAPREASTSRTGAG
jgi:hypothetical protein